MILTDEPAGFTRVHRRGAACFLLRLETSSRAEDYARYEDLRGAIWGFPEDRLAGPRNLLCENYFHDGTSLFIAAYEAGPEGAVEETSGRLAGFSYGFVGVRDKAIGFRSLDNLWFYSQYTGIRPDVEGSGLGLAIKEFQRDILRDLYGIGSVVCTFDPLTAVNAHRNIRRLGMSVLEYRPSLYGEFGGRLNRRDVPSDRFFAHWDIGPGAPGPRAPEASDAAAPPVLDVRYRMVEGRTGPVELETAAGLDLGAAGASARIRIPSDFYFLLQETDVEDAEVRRIPLDWRLRTREAFQDLLEQGFRVAAFYDRLPGEDGPGYILKKT
jgi:predicted GNAT superfamily acetyltransferase